MAKERRKQSIKKVRAFRHFTLSKGKSAGRNSAGRITSFHRGGGAKRLQRKIDLKRSTPSVGIVERIEYDPNRSCRIALVRWTEGVPPPSPRRPSGIHIGLEKYRRNIPFAPFKDVSLALRGALGSSNSSFYSKDGLRLSSSLEQLRGCLSNPLAAVRPKMSPPGSRSLHTSPLGIVRPKMSSPGGSQSLHTSPLGIVGPKMSSPGGSQSLHTSPLVTAPSGSRSLHTSQPLSIRAANRPLSPHLPLKKPQFSATFSISHRIFGAALGVAIISVPLATKFSLMFDV